MNAKELATVLNGREYGMEITKDEEQQAANAGLVTVYGYSDDNVELRGAIDEEIGAYGGATLYIGKDGLVNDPACGIAENVECPYFTAAKKAAKSIRAVWHNVDGLCWTFETDIPHETFTVNEDGKPFCEGIVFNVADLSAPPPNAPLTLEELREMGGEPYWHVGLQDDSPPPH